MKINDSDFLDFFFDERCELLNRGTGVEEFRIWPIPDRNPFWGAIEYLLSGKFKDKVDGPLRGWSVVRLNGSRSAGTIFSGQTAMFEVSAMVYDQEDNLFNKLELLLNRNADS